MPIGSKDKDYTQGIKESYDPAIERLRVDALINDGVDALVINPDGSINVNLSGGGIVVADTINEVEVGTVQTVYNQITSVASGIETQIALFTATSSSRIKIIEASGTNIGTFTIYVNNVVINKRRTYFGGELNTDFEFSKGYMLSTNDIVKATILHNRPYVGDFNAFILVLTNS